MAFYKGLVPLRDVLADLYPSAALAQVVVAEAGIPPQLVDFEGPALRFWTNILFVAQNNNQVQYVIDVARKHFPRNEGLIDAETQFHYAPIPDPSTDQSTQPGETRDISSTRVVNVGDITGNGNAIVSGDNVTINNHSNRAVFDQRGQKVAAQYNVAGDVQDRAAAITELRKLPKETNQARAASERDDGVQ